MIHGSKKIRWALSFKVSLPKEHSSSFSNQVVGIDRGGRKKEEEQEKRGNSVLPEIRNEGGKRVEKEIEEEIKFCWLCENIRFCERDGGYSLSQKSKSLSHRVRKGAERKREKCSCGIVYFDEAFPSVRFNNCDWNSLKTPTASISMFPARLWDYRAAFLYFGRLY